jgi:transcriptional regulator with XRE-family HTH domain
MGAKRAAEGLIQSLLKLGWSQKRIAGELNVAESTISRALNNPSWPIGSKLEESLRRLEFSARRDLLSSLVARNPITVIEACHSRVPLTDKLRAQLATTLSAALVNEIADEGQELVWPKGIEGSLARLGHPASGLYLIAIDPNLNEDGRRILAHELQRMVERLRAGAKKTPSTIDYQPESEF